MRLTIESLAYGGAGVARTPDGLTVFVDGGCPGDTVEAEETERHPRFVRARVTSVLEPSPDRVQPPCPYFGACGGCQWQHVSYPAQCAAKTAAVTDAFRRIGRLDAGAAPVLASPDAYGYRNRVELRVLPTPRGPQLGFTRHASNEIVPVEECLLLPPKSRRAPRALGGALRYLAGRAEVEIDRVALKVSRSGEVEVDVWTAPGPFPRQLAAKVITDAVKARTVTRVIAKGPSEARKVVKVEVLSGPGAWRETLGQDRYLVSAPSFFQVNTRSAEALRDLATGAIRDSGASFAVDAYAGVGTFTLPLARFSDVVAIESSSHALADLRRNLDAAGLDAEIVPGDAGREMAEIDEPDAVIVDPPRSGLGDEASRALIGTRPGCIVYVSCDPATLARDAKAISEAGYALTGLMPVDMFPQTYHVETVAVFTRS